MHGAVQLLKIETSTLRTCSRIPHLRAHILARGGRATSTSRKRPCQPNSHPRAGKHPQRYASTHTSALSDLHVHQETAPDNHNPSWRPKVEHHVQGEDDSSHAAPATVQDDVQKKKVASAWSRFEYADLEQYVTEGHPEKIMFALQNKDISLDFARLADDATFTRAICALDAAYFIEPFIAVYRNLDPHLHAVRVPYNPTNRLVRTFEDRWQSFSQQINSLRVQRTASGHRLTLGVLRHLLKCAGIYGDEPLARYVFLELMPQHEVTPDLECYNHFLKALAWSSWNEMRFRGKTRVIPAYLEHRKRPQPGSGMFRGYSAPEIDPSSPEAIRLDALRTFEVLTKQGLQGNEQTYINLMLAMSQAGDLEGIKSILKSVWNINVDLLTQYDEEEIESPTYYEDDSPLRPSHELLETVVHVFGNNNDASLAYQLLDYLSRYYNLPIAEDLWHRLYVSTFILAHKAPGGLANRMRQAKYGYSWGQLHSSALRNLFDTITAEPHNLKPTVWMYVMLARLQILHRHLDRCEDYVRKAATVLEEEKTSMSLLYDEMVGLVRSFTIPTDFVNNDYFYQLRRRFILQSIRLEDSLQVFLRMAARLMEEKEWPGSGREVKWSNRRLPNIIKEFDAWLPAQLHYQTPTGYIQIENSAVHRWKAIELADNRFHQKVGWLRNKLEADEFVSLAHNVERIPIIMELRENFCEWCEKPGHNRADCEIGKHLMAGHGDPEGRDNILGNNYWTSPYQRRPSSVENTGGSAGFDHFSATVSKVPVKSSSMFTPNPSSTSAGWHGYGYSQTEKLMTAGREGRVDKSTRGR